MTKNKFKQNIRETSATYLIAAFSLVAGLAWNEAIKALIEYIFPLDKNTLIAKFSYAVIITLFVIFITAYLKRILNSKK